MYDLLKAKFVTCIHRLDNGLSFCIYGFYETPSEAGVKIPPWQYV